MDLGGRPAAAARAREGYLRLGGLLASAHYWIPEASAAARASSAMRARNRRIFKQNGTGLASAPEGSPREMTVATLPSHTSTKGWLEPGRIGVGGRPLIAASAVHTLLKIYGKEKNSLMSCCNHEVSHR